MTEHWQATFDWWLFRVAFPICIGAGLVILALTLLFRSLP